MAKRKENKNKKQDKLSVDEIKLSVEEIARMYDKPREEIYFQLYNRFSDVKSRSEDGRVMTEQNAHLHKPLTAEEIAEIERETESFRFPGPRTIVDFLKEKYEDVTEAKVENAEAGTRRCFRARKGDRKLFIKVDKKIEEITSKKAKRNMANKHGTEAEVELSLKIPLNEAFTNHLSCSIDKEEYNGLVISVEEDVEGQSLKRRIAGGKLLNLKEFKQVFSDVLKAERCLVGRGILHRDLSPGNILILEGSEGLEARIVDLANGCEKSDIRGPCPEHEPTLGGGIIADPLVFSKKMKYDESSEVYAVVSDMVIALTGKPVADYDYIRESKVDARAHNAAVEEALKRIPKESRRFSKMLRKGLSLDINERYKSLDEFAKAFEKSGSPTLFERVKRNAKVAVAAGLILTALGTGVVSASKMGLIPVGLIKPSTSLEQKVSSEQRYLDVQPEYNGSTMRIENNLFSSDFDVRDENYQLVYGTDCDGKVSKKVPLHLKAGQKIRVIPAPNPVPLPSDVADTRWSKFDGRFYIEGFDETSKEFFATPTVDHTRHTDSFLGFGNSDVEITIPEDMPEGTYFLTMDVYARKNADEKNLAKNSGSNNMERTQLRFPEGTIIGRSKMPIVIGNPKDILCPTSAQIGLGGNLNVKFNNPADHLAKISKDIAYEASIRDGKRETSLGLAVNSAGNCSDLNVWLLDNLRAGEQATVRITARNAEKKEIGRYEVPVECFSAGVNANGKPYSFYHIPSKVKRNYQTGRRR